MVLLHLVDRPNVHALGIADVRAQARVGARLVVRVGHGHIGRSVGAADGLHRIGVPAHVGGRNRQVIGNREGGALVDMGLGRHVGKRQRSRHAEEVRVVLAVGARRDAAFHLRVVVRLHAEAAALDGGAVIHVHRGLGVVLDVQRADAQRCVHQSRHQGNSLGHARAAEGFRPDRHIAIGIDVSAAQQVDRGVSRHVGDDQIDPEQLRHKPPDALSRGNRQAGVLVDRSAAVSIRELGLHDGVGVDLHGLRLDGAVGNVDLRGGVRRAEQGHEIGLQGAERDLAARVAVVGVGQQIGAVSQRDLGRGERDVAGVAGRQFAQDGGSLLVVGQATGKVHLPRRQIDVIQRDALGGLHGDAGAGDGGAISGDADTAAGEDVAGASRPIDRGRIDQDGAAQTARGTGFEPAALDGHGVVRRQLELPAVAAGTAMGGDARTGRQRGVVIGVHAHAAARRSRTLPAGRHVGTGRQHHVATGMDVDRAGLHARGAIGGHAAGDHGVGHRGDAHHAIDHLDTRGRGHAVDVDQIGKCRDGLRPGQHLRAGVHGHLAAHQVHGAGRVDAALDLDQAAFGQRDAPGQRVGQRRVIDRAQR